ncbi:(2Fe-2S)-binding protein [Streptomyces sp. TP-A0874]|uniref:(2Fe-2S)-binding protein n=1 Tax=Streptomyces sp. TP-A0874 TaxID=549819 RepID=UPI000852FF83|nr:(2Fe-2S)-binding protein [Streptomyces sp. TP-A0874]
MALAPAVSATPAVSSASPDASPLATAYTRLAEVFPSLQVVEGPPRTGAGWVTAADLAAGGEAVDYFLAEESKLLSEYGTPGRPDVVAGFGLHRYAWAACLLITLPWFLLNRVPRVPVEAVSYHRGIGRMTLWTDGFACLPDDPAAGSPLARVVPDAEALRAEVRSAVAEHLAPVMEGFRPRMRRGRRALWGMATDEIVEGLWYIAHLLDEERRAMAELGMLLPGSTDPYVGGSSFRQLTGPQGESLPTRDRASCCLYYTMRPEATCVTCPRTCDEERVSRLTTG